MQGFGTKVFEEARSLERLELEILKRVREEAPGTERAFPVSVQQWGGKLEVNGIYATNRGHFFFIDADSEEGLTVNALETRKALDLVNLLGKMGVVGNRTRLSDLAFADSAMSHPPAVLPPPAKDADPAADSGAGPKQK